MYISFKRYCFGTTFLKKHKKWDFPVISADEDQILKKMWILPLVYDLSGWRKLMFFNDCHAGAVKNAQLETNKNIVSQFVTQVPSKIHNLKFTKNIIIQFVTQVPSSMHNQKLTEILFFLHFVYFWRHLRAKANQPKLLKDYQPFLLTNGRVPSWVTFGWFGKLLK